jgi:multiple sugar transport system substrate-binding protein
MRSALTVLFTASLSVSATAADQPLSIWWAQWAPADGLQQLADEYAKTPGGVAVRVHQIPWGSFQDQVFLNLALPAVVWADYPQAAIRRVG